MDLAGTWNTTGTPTLIKANVTDTASNAASLLMDLQVGGVSQFNVTKAGRANSAIGFGSVSLGTAGAPSFFYSGGGGVSGIYFPTVGSIGFVATTEQMRLVNGQAIRSLNGYSIGSSISSAGDVILARDDANILAQRNGVNAQAFRVYNTYTDASNYERANMEWNTNRFRIFTDKAGTGASRSIDIISSNEIQFWTGSTQNWRISTSGHFLANTDNLYDIGAFGATRPRNGYFSDSVVAPKFAVTDGVTAPGATVGLAKIYVDTADGDLKVIFGDGTIKTLATDT
jgi:hypothetical protein